MIEWDQSLGVVHHDTIKQNESELEKYIQLNAFMLYSAENPSKLTLRTLRF